MWNKKLHLPRLFIFKSVVKKNAVNGKLKKKDTGPRHGKIKMCNFIIAITFNLKKIETKNILFFNSLPEWSVLKKSMRWPCHEKSTLTWIDPAAVVLTCSIDPVFTINNLKCIKLILPTFNISRTELRLENGLYKDLQRSSSIKNERKVPSECLYWTSFSW